jgi:aldehyde:ferredoxin oxidoreductase
MGLTFADDTLPPALLNNKLGEGKSITRSELEKLILDYYKIRGWDKKGVSSKIVSSPCGE